MTVCVFILCIDRARKRSCCLLEQSVEIFLLLIPLKQTDMEYYKLEIFIPESHFAELRKALQEADAGHIGNYDSCLSYSRVISTWRPLAGTDPFIGRENEISEEEELKVEVTVTGERIEETIAAVKAVHPYEEPVINVIRLYRTGI